MSMIACFCTADATAVAQLKADPELMGGYLHPAGGQDEPPNCVDIDKAWHCLHFMLTGSAAPDASPLSQVVFGGEPCGDDMGYGAARILSPDQLREIVAALAEIDETTFRARFAPDAMADAELYLGEVALDEGDEFLDYLVAEYLKLNEFYRAAAACNDSVILWLC